MACYLVHQKLKDIILIDEFSEAEQLDALSKFLINACVRMKRGPCNYLTGAIEHIAETACVLFGSQAIPIEQGNQMLPDRRNKLTGRVEAVGECEPPIKVTSGYGRLKMHQSSRWSSIIKASDTRVAPPFRPRSSTGTRAHVRNY